MTALRRAGAGRLIWRQIHWSRPLDADLAAGVLRYWAADQRSPRLILEARAAKGELRYLIASPKNTTRFIDSTLTGLNASLTGEVDRTPVNGAGKLKASTRHRAVRTDRPDATARTVLEALIRAGEDEELVLQIVLGPRRVPLAIPNNSPSSIVMPWYQVAWRGNGGQVDGEKRSALRDKVSDHGFACDIRVGVRAGSSRRRTELVLGVLAALRTVEAPGVKLRLSGESADRLNTAATPTFWPLRLNVGEVLAATGWPVGDGDLPGQPPAHPHRLPPAPGTTARGRVVAKAVGPGPEDVVLRLSAEDARHHMHVLGPTGTGKSVLLSRLIASDIADGRGVIVVDPQGDLVQTVLTQIPEDRQDDVVVLDASDQCPVGFNPLASGLRNPEVVADSLLSVFKVLYAEAWGPRTQDILHACLLTLAGRPDASIVMLPVLLTNPAYRRRVTESLTDPIALQPFWAWYERLSAPEQQQAIAAPMNKLRQWLLRPSLRAMLGQTDPKFHIGQVFTENKILLVSLASGIIGPEAASLLGSLVVAELWQATLERAGVPADNRRPVMVYLDEFATFLNLPTNLADALARSRGMGVAYTLAHQFLAQLTPAMRAAVLSNTRSRVCFQLSPEDAVTVARSTSELVPEDFTSLGAHEVYASLFAGGRTQPYASGVTLPPLPAISDADAVRAGSRQRYGRPIADVEAAWTAALQPDNRTTNAAESGPRRPRRQT